MKAIILAMLLFAVPVSASAKMSDEDCARVSGYILFAAMGRDLGSHPQDILAGLVGRGLEHDAAMSILEAVFLTMPDASPDEVAISFFNYCTSEAV